MPYKDPVKQKEAQHQHYLNNKEKYTESTNKSRAPFKRRRALWMQEIKTNLACKECGEARYPCLDFHHRDPKEKDFNVGWAVYIYSKKRILEELEKCDVLCKNCHAIYHYEERWQSG